MLVALAALPVVFTLLELRKPEFGTPALALTLRTWSVVAHVAAGVLIVGTAISEIWLSLDSVGQWLFGVYGAAAAIAVLGIAAFYLSFVAELPPPPPKPLKPKKEKKQRRRRGKKDDEADEGDRRAMPTNAEADDEAETADDDAEASDDKPEAEATAETESTAEEAPPMLPTRRDDARQCRRSTADSAIGARPESGHTVAGARAAASPSTSEPSSQVSSWW